MAPPCLTVYDLSNCFAFHFHIFICCCIFCLLHIFTYYQHRIVDSLRQNKRERQRECRSREKSTRKKNWKADWHVRAQRMINIHIAHSVRICCVLIHVYNAIIYCISCIYVCICVWIYLRFIFYQGHIKWSIGIFLSQYWG